MAAERSGGGQLRLPPRAKLPAGVLIERIPVVGTTWYERGAAYWLRRTGMLALLVFGLWLMTLLLTGLFRAIRGTSVTGFWIALVTEIAYSAATFGYLIFKFRQARQHPLEVRPAEPGKLRRAGSSGGAIGLLARTGSLAAGVFLVLGAVLSYGMLLAVIATYCLPYLTQERAARCRLAAVLKSRGSAAQGS